jgi:hypothetical protein
MVEGGMAPVGRIKGQTRMRLLVKLGCDENAQTLCRALYDDFAKAQFEGCTFSLLTNPQSML